MMSSNWYTIFVNKQNKNSICICKTAQRVTIHIHSHVIHLHMYLNKNSKKTTSKKCTTTYIMQNVTHDYHIYTSKHYPISVWYHNLAMHATYIVKQNSITHLPHTPSIITPNSQHLPIYNIICGAPC